MIQVPLSITFTSKYLLRPFKSNQQHHIFLAKRYYKPSLLLSDAYAQVERLIYDTKLRTSVIMNPKTYVPKEWKNSDIKLLSLRQKMNPNVFNSNIEQFNKAELDSFYDILTTYRPTSNSLGEINTLNRSKELNAFWTRENDELLINEYVKHRANLFLVQLSFPSLTVKNILDRLEEFYYSSFSWTPDENDIFINTLNRVGQDWSQISELLTNRDAVDCKIYFFIRRCTYKNMQKTPFSEEENKKLLGLLKTYGTGKWKVIKEKFENSRSIFEIKRQFFVLSNSSGESLWKAGENSKLYDLMTSDKYQSWSAISKKFNGTRTGKELQSQWLKINPFRKTGKWSEEEIEDVNVLFTKHKSWPKVAYFLKSRTSQECQYQWALQCTKTTKKVL